MSLPPHLAAVQRLFDQIAPQPAPTHVTCTHCGGSGETHSAYRDNTCPACDGVGSRRSDWRERMAAQEEEIE
jgi:DnaJ-class molecular chaperone